jgi:hypothetical protein
VEASIVSIVCPPVVPYFRPLSDLLLQLTDMVVTLSERVASLGVVFVGG